MPRGPNGEKRPADANQRASMILKIATGEIKEDRAVRKEGNPPIKLIKSVYQSE